MGQFARWIGALVVVGGQLLPHAVRADQSISTLQAQEGDADRPWAKGVPLAKQEAARETFEEANSLLKDSIFKTAAQKYLDALQQWDHPGIHFNLALTLVSLEKPVEAYEHFKKAIAFGVAPIDEDKLERAKSYIALFGAAARHRED
jgi:tetratricopeptide (TPR) repeat protein